MWFPFLVLTWLVAATQIDLTREDFEIESEPGISIFVRQVAPLRASGAPVLLLHGARVPGIPSFDLPVEGGSLAGDLAREGHQVYVMDARGYGRSTRMPEMSQPPDGKAALARSSEIVRDIDAVVKEIALRQSGSRPVLFGWATGGHWVGLYASLYSERIAGVILLNTLYGATATHPSLGHGSDLEDPRRPGRFNRALYGAYRLSTSGSLLAAWDRSIPMADKTKWRSPEVAAAYVSAAMASDDTSTSRAPASFRAPSGAMEDSFYLATGRQLWDASLIRVPMLVVRSGHYFWSRPQDVELMAAHAAHAEVQTLTIPDATHFVHLDRPDRGRAKLLQEVRQFLAKRQ